jgi:hypothetical protein
MAHKHLAVLLFALSAIPALAQNDAATSSDGSSGSFVVKIFPERQAERRQSRWTLGTWMKQKRQIEDQNRWLWEHTNKIPMEFALGAAMSPSRWRSDLDIYVARLGLRASYGRRFGLIKDKTTLDAGPNDDTSQVSAQIRLFGGNLQDSYLLSRVGYEFNGFNNAGMLGGGFGSWFVEPELQLYLAQWLGVRGTYRYRWAGSQLTRKTQKWDGPNREAIAFLEMGALRLEGGYRWMNWRIDSVGTLKNDEIIGALKLFF